MRRKVKRPSRRKADGQPLTLGELNVIITEFGACIGGREYLEQLIQKYGKDAPARWAWRDLQDHHDGGWLDWLFEECVTWPDSTGKTPIKGPHRTKYEECSRRWVNDAKCDAATARRCYPWDDIEAAIWASGLVKRQPPPLKKLTLEERVKQLEDIVYQRAEAT